MDPLEQMFDQWQTWSPTGAGGRVGREWDAREDEEMTKRYREDLEEVEVEEGVDGIHPVAFRWRGHHYRVTSVLGHWREDPGWWRRPSGEPIRVEQSDLWRVEAANGRPSAGIYELVRRGGDQWRLDRVWD